MLTKNTFVEEMRKQYVLVARAKGLSQKRVLFKHIFRNALIPLITGFPAAFIGAFFAGSVLIETLFSLDGLGLLSYESVVRRDYPVVLGSLYLFTLIGLVVKLIADLLYVLVDPRVQFESVGKWHERRARRPAAGERGLPRAGDDIGADVAEPARVGRASSATGWATTRSGSSSCCWCSRRWPS